MNANNKLKFVHEAISKSENMIEYLEYDVDKQFNYLIDPSTFNKFPSTSDYQYVMHVVDIKFISQPTVLTLNYDKVFFIGDIHGNYDSLINALYTIYQDENLPKNHAILFLGDIIDRGNKSSLCLFLVYILIITTKNIFLLRGNHEYEPLFGCYNTIGREIGNDFADNQSRITFSHIPLAAIVNEHIFAVHGCIPNHGFLGFDKRIDIINSLDKNDIQGVDISGSWNDVSNEYLMMWSDPIAPKNKVLAHICNYPNRGHSCTQVKVNKIEQFMEKFDFNLLVRGHQFYPSGFAYLSLYDEEKSKCEIDKDNDDNDDKDNDDKDNDENGNENITIKDLDQDLSIITLASSRGYKGQESDAALLSVSNNQAVITIFDQYNK